MTTVLAHARDDDSDDELLTYWHAGCGGLHVTDAAPSTQSVCGQPPPVRVGVWRHRAGGHYLVLGVAHDDRGGEPRVVYVRLYVRAGLPVSARRVSVFTDSDDAGPRFAWIGDTDPG